MPGLTEQNRSMRKDRIGASEVGVLLDCGHPFKDRLALYREKALGEDTFTGSLNAVEMGHLLEPVVLSLGTKRTGVQVTANHITLPHSTLPLAVTCDAYVIGTSNTIPVEVKTASAFQKDAWANGPPAHYVAQVQAQLMVTGGHYGYLWALLGGRDFYEFTIVEDIPMQEAIAKGITDFFNDHITPRIPPEGSVAAAFGSFDVPKGTMAADQEMESIGTTIRLLMDAADTTKDSLDAARGALIGLMSAASVNLVTSSGFTAEVKPTKTGGTTLRFTRNKNVRIES